MRIVDAHAHIFPHIQGQVGSGPTKGLGYGRMLVGSDEIQLMPAHNEETIYSAEMLLANMDWAGVERAVLLQGPFYGECNAYAQDAARRYPDRLQAVAYLDPWRDGLRAQWAAVGSFSAVKMECSVKTGLCGLYSRARLDDPGLRWLWDALEESGKVLVLDLGHIGGEAYQTAAVREIAVGHEGLRVVIAHLGQPAPQMVADAELMRLWREQIDLGRFGQCIFRYGGLAGLRWRGGLSLSDDPALARGGDRSYRSRKSALGHRSAGAFAAGESAAVGTGSRGAIGFPCRRRSSPGDGAQCVGGL